MATVKRDNPKAFDTLNARLKELEGKQAKVGWFATSKYEDGTPVAYIAAIQEFGSPKNNIPPRPFMRPTVIHQKNEWIQLLTSGARSILAGKSSITTVMNAIGLKASADIAKSITQVFSPPLKPATIAARKRKRADKKTLGLLTKPLVDTGLMLNTVTYVVEDDK